MLLHDLILTSANSYADKTALISGETEYDYESLRNLTAAAAAGLVELGVRPGDRIGICLGKRIESVVAYFAAGYAGAIFVPINPSLKPAQIQHILNDCDVLALVTGALQANALVNTMGDCKALRHLIIVDETSNISLLPLQISSITWQEFLKASSDVTDPAKRIDADIAAILYTSGSTGKPKGVILSHHNMIAGAQSVAGYIGNNCADKILAVLPFSFDAGFSQLTTGFLAGATVILMDYLLPKDVIRAAARHQATGLTGVPPLWNQLARLDWPQEATDNMRYIASTGGTMPTATLAALRKKLPQSKVFLMYGLTESFRSTFLPPEEVDKRPTSIGKAIPNAEVLVVNDQGDICGPGEPGELVHRGALVALGYWNDKGKTAERFRPTPARSRCLPFHEIAVWSGDTVVTDEDGFLYFVGRIDDMIKSSAYRISPTELEEVVYATGLVIECAAIGLPHPDLGQAVVIACVTDNSGDAVRDALFSSCKEELPNYMVPLKILMINALPRNPNGKIDRKALANKFANLFVERAKL